MSRQGPGALWKSNSWSTTAVAMVDTHSIAHCAALQAKGIKTPAPLLGHVSSLLLQWKLFVSVIVVPRIGGGGGAEILKQTRAKRGRCCEGPGKDISFLRFSLGTTVVSGRFLAFPEAFLFRHLTLC